ncbi:NAD(P)/FAD-dependent oxidoreductase [Neisseria sp. ZJ106]|uniref:NAD(P)/FAD-dependent oxidoreductase n=1 Tax=Neisseria lisongii TaxID=2912188 RepID=A0ABY7RME1_9NEIS|nr:NAD(P)/FAD-dependent oxidoreductase [Neisseria lisongii]MCF7521085.1 NAD(P)/FAD-dependent oxidoreductase [Neisseria lisongii]WCL72408.1 NAD(P)/FAD-dependent oxidoreductase [Neisseria lisongii]
MERQTCDVAIIGAGPAGSVAAALLKRQGFNVCVLEKQHFPRFVIGESLLPHCMEFIEAAGFLPAVEAEPGFQFKNGAAFTWGNRYTEIDFTDKFSNGPGTTFQVRRDRFDQILIEEAAKQGVDVRFGESVTAFDAETACLTVETERGENYILQAKFVLDASGYGRVLPRLLDLDTPSDLPPRQAHFTHIDDNISDSEFDRNKILISTHPQYRDVWLWLIPFADNRCSIGVVGLPERFENMENSEQIVKRYAAEVPMLARVLANANWDNEMPFRCITGYSANVKALYGKHFALLGNAAEFLDPVFSSGVTIAMHSAKLACDVLGKQLRGEEADWETEFVQPLMSGVDAFRTYVNGWYDGRFQDVIYADEQRTPEITRMISAILAGYAWDTDNPYVAKSERRLAALAETVGPAELR